MSVYPLSIAGYGDGALMVTIAAAGEAERRRMVREFRDQLVEDLPPGVDDVVSGLESLLVEFDPLLTSSEQVAFALGALGRAEPRADAARREARVFDVPIVVDSDTAPDLADVATELGVSTKDVLAALERSRLTVSLLAAAMAPMMDGLDMPAPVRRQATPRTDVPAGSIMIAGRNALIQPFPGPTGWRVIGRTPLTIVDIERDDPIAFAPGDVFRFRSVPKSVAGALAGKFLSEVSHGD